jgi:hypothetical protein
MQLPLITSPPKSPASLLRASVHSLVALRESTRFPLVESAAQFGPFVRSVVEHEVPANLAVVDVALVCAVCGSVVDLVAAIRMAATLKRPTQDTKRRRAVVDVLQWLVAQRACSTVGVTRGDFVALRRHATSDAFYAKLATLCRRVSESATSLVVHDFLSHMYGASEAEVAPIMRKELEQIRDYIFTCRWWARQVAYELVYDATLTPWELVEAYGNSRGCVDDPPDPTNGWADVAQTLAEATSTVARVVLRRGLRRWALRTHTLPMLVAWRRAALGARLAREAASDADPRSCSNWARRLFS